jgi:hypothetical protein
VAATRPDRARGAAAMRGPDAFAPFATVSPRGSDILLRGAVLMNRSPLSHDIDLSIRSDSEHDQFGQDR